MAQAHIFILGGSGRVGQLFIAEALKRGHQVTALVRKEASIPAQANLSIVVGLPTSSADILNALTSIHSSEVVIVSTLGQTRKSGNPWAATTSPPKFMAESTQAVIGAISSLQQSSSTSPKVSKLVQLSMFGAKSSMANLNFLMRLIMAYSNMAQTVEDHNLVTDTIQANLGNSSLDIPFVMVRPAMLKFGATENGQIRVHEEDGTGAGFMPSIQARDVARFLADAVDSEEWNGKTPVISNR